MRATLIQILQRSGLVRRRDVRFIQRAVVDEQGAPVAGGAILTLTEQGVRLQVRERWMVVRALPAPVLMVHKPAGVVCSRTPDGGHVPVFELVPARWAHLPWLAVGRLDADTTGLLILTCDGGLVQRMTHPKRAVERHYVAGTAEPLSVQALAHLRSGELVLRDGVNPRPSLVQPVAPPLELDDMLSWTHVVLGEGRYHEVRRMLAAVGHRVERLHRFAFGPLALQEGAAAEATGSTQAHSVDEGDVLWVDADGVRAVYAAVGMGAPPAILVAEWEDGGELEDEEYDDETDASDDEDDA
jgi:16S rRNA pseudouridine516 synthase